MMLQIGADHSLCASQWTHAGACLEMALLRDLPALQMSIEQLGYIPPPPLPMNVTGQMDLTQAMTGPVDNGTAATRGYVVVPSGMPYFSNASQVTHHSNSTTYLSDVQCCSQSIYICQRHIISAAIQHQVSWLSSC